MNFEQMKMETAKRANDPDMGKYRSVIGNALIQSVGELIRGEDYLMEEYNFLVKDTNYLIPSDEWRDNEYSIRLDLTDNNDKLYLMKLIDVFIDPSRDDIVDITLKEVEFEHIKRMKNETVFQPAGNEVFWYRLGNKIRFFKSIEMGTENTPANVKIKILYLKRPLMSDFSSSSNLIDDGFSTPLLYGTIDRAVEIITKTGGSE